MEIFHDIPMKEYRAWKEKSQSDIKKAWKSIRHYTTPFGEETQAMKIGSIFHQMILEPHLDEYWVVGPAYRKNTNVYKDWFSEQPEGTVIIGEDDLAALRLMKESLFSNRQAKMIMDAIQDVEVSAKGPVNEVNFDMKARADGLTGPAVIDLKTTIDASPDGFSKSIDKFRYDVQSAVYAPAFDRELMVFVCVENKAPFNCAVYQLDEEAMEAGSKILETCGKRIEQYEKDKVLTSYQDDKADGIEPIGLPYWAYKSIF